MSVSGARAQLGGAWSELRVHWDTARRSWNDAAALAFEREFLEPFEPSIKAAGNAMEDMADVLARLRRECE